MSTRVTCGELLRCALRQKARDAGRECYLVVGRYVEVAVLMHEGVVLLLPVRHTGRERR